MSQTPGIYRSTDLVSRSKGEVHAIDADERRGKCARLVRMQSAVV